MLFVDLDFFVTTILEQEEKPGSCQKNNIKKEEIKALKSICKRTRMNDQILIGVLLIMQLMKFSETGVEIGFFVNL